jgi:hypothetical protein
MAPVKRVGRQDPGYAALPFPEVHQTAANLTTSTAKLRYDVLSI